VGVEIGGLGAVAQVKGLGSDACLDCGLVAGDLLSALAFGLLANVSDDLTESRVGWLPTRSS
jgi:hypothetical protein